VALILLVDTDMSCAKIPIKTELNATRRCMSARKYVNMMEQDYVSIQKGSGYVYACINMLYQHVKTTGNFKYLKCSRENVTVRQSWLKISLFSVLLCALSYVLI